MNQISIFDYQPDNESDQMMLKLEPESRLNTLKRSIKGRKFEPEAIEKRLMKRIGTLSLHKISHIKDVNVSTKYYDYLIRKIHSTFFKMHVELITEEKNEEQIKAISKILSDDTTTVTLELAERRYSSMTKGVSFYIHVKDHTRTITYITGTEQTGKTKHRRGQYYPQYGLKSTRMITAVNRIFAEILLEKEMRHYYQGIDRQSEYMTFMKSIVFQDGKLFMDKRIRERKPEIAKSMIEDAEIQGVELETTSPKDTYMYNANLYYYGDEDICTLDVLNNPPKYEDINGSYDSFIRRKLVWSYLKAIIPKIREVKYHASSLRKSSSDYASTYQMKKNIPEKTILKMKNSKLLKYFTNVEYDELVDLSSINQFETEIVSFIEQFGIKIPENASFKVRRLGKLRAAGVFYPGYCTLAVDVNHPAAFVHEFWHMIDYYMIDNEVEFTGWRLSSRQEFSEIICKYKEIITNLINQYPEDSPIKLRHFGKTKYNKDYFFENTEVFARCAEMYFATKLGNKSSLVKDQFSVYYPEDVELRKLIDAYFMKLLKEGDHEETNAA